MVELMECNWGSSMVQYLAEMLVIVKVDEKV